jgi:hypothetical protein
MATPKPDGGGLRIGRAARKRSASGLPGATRYGGGPPCAVCHTWIVLSGAQINSFSVQGELLLARSNLRSRGFHIDRIGSDTRVRVFVRPFLGILSERTGLIAKKGPPRLSRPSVWCRQVARYRGLRDCETEHQKLAVNPWSTPEKILTGHPGDQTTELAGNPWTPASPATTRSISPHRGPAATAPAQDGLGLDDHQTFAPVRPPAR